MAWSGGRQARPRPWWAEAPSHRAALDRLAAGAMAWSGGRQARPRLWWGDGAVTPGGTRPAGGRQRWPGPAAGKQDRDHGGLRRRHTGRHSTGWRPAAMAWSGGRQARPRPWWAEAPSHRAALDRLAAGAMARSGGRQARPRPRRGDEAVTPGGTRPAGGRQRWPGPAAGKQDRDHGGLRGRHTGRHSTGSRLTSTPRPRPVRERVTAEASDGPAASKTATLAG